MTGATSERAGRTGAGPCSGRLARRMRITSRRTLRIASVPATHVYVRRLEHPRITRLEDPSGDDLRTPCFLDPDWLDANHAEFDLLHVHFGMEFYGRRRIEAVADVLDRHGRPLVYTCHDLRNPNHRDRALHDGHLDVLLSRADHVITLTASAAQRIRERWGRDATVLAHPHVVPLGELRRRTRRARSEHEGYRVGLHFKSLRPNMATSRVLDGVEVALAQEPRLRIRIDVHHDAVDPRHDNHDRGLVERLWSLVADADSRVELHVHHYLSEHELWDYLESVDAFLLPYRFGTHSGLLEACRDLGTAVIAPTVGAYADQGAHQLFRTSESAGVDPDDLARAILAAVAAGRPEPVPVRARRRQRRAIAQAHHDLYRRLVGERRR